ncbi:putative transposase [Burkholderia lata]|nr:putative transposase [Burkholderia lata]
MDDTVWDHSTFNKNRDRQLAHDVIVGLLNETVETAHARGYLSGEYSASMPRRFRRERVEQLFLLTQAAYNPTRIRTLTAKAA